MSRYELHPGDRVRAKVRTISGWKGTGTVIHADFNAAIIIEKDDMPPDSYNTAHFARHELAKIRSVQGEGE